VRRGERHPRGRPHPLHDLRVAAGLTITEVITRADIARSTWFVLAAPGKRLPGIITLAALAQALNVPMGEVLHRIRHEHPTG
jgi:transcriptional regulator with XRE-family HTH domain